MLAGLLIAGDATLRSAATSRTPRPTPPPSRPAERLSPDDGLEDPDADSRRTAVQVSDDEEFYAESEIHGSSGMPSTTPTFVGSDTR